MIFICRGKLDNYTYDAMWCTELASRVEIPDIFPDDSHKHREYNMSTKPENSSNLNSDRLKHKAEEVFNEAPPEVKQAVVQTKSFYEENKRVIHTVAVGLVVLKVYKRKIAKQTAKTVVKALAKTDLANTSQDLPTLLEIWSDLKSTPNMAYIPTNGGMVHLLGPSKDVIVTIFGDFKNMSNDQIFNYARQALGLNR